MSENNENDESYLVWGTGYNRMIPGDNPTNVVTAKNLKDRHEVYNDDAIRLSENTIRKLNRLRDKPVCVEHDKSVEVGKIKDCQIDTKNGCFRVLCELYNRTPKEKETIADMKSGKLKGFSVGYKVMPTEPGGRTVSHKEFDELTLCKEPFFPGCVFHVQGSSASSSSNVGEMENDNLFGNFIAVTASSVISPVSATVASRFKLPDDDLESLVFVRSSYKQNSSNIDQNISGEMTDPVPATSAPATSTPTGPSTTTTAPTTPAPQISSPEIIGMMKNYNMATDEAAAERKKNEELMAKMKALEEQYKQTQEQNQQMAEFLAREDAKFREAELPKALKAIEATAALRGVPYTEAKKAEIVETLCSRHPEARKWSDAYYGVVASADAKDKERDLAKQEAERAKQEAERAVQEANKEKAEMAAKYERMMQEIAAAQEHAKQGRYYNSSSSSSRTPTPAAATTTTTAAPVAAVAASKGDPELPVATGFYTSKYVSTRPASYMHDTGYDAYYDGRYKPFTNKFEVRSESEIGRICAGIAQYSGSKVLTSASDPSGYQITASADGKGDVYNIQCSADVLDHPNLAATTHSIRHTAAAPIAAMILADPENAFKDPDPRFVRMVYGVKGIGGTPKHARWEGLGQAMPTYEAHYAENIDAKTSA